MKMPLALGLILTSLLLLSACGGTPKPKPFILPEDWETKPTVERLEYVFTETGHCPYEGPTGPASTRLTLIDVAPDQLTLGLEYEVFEEGTTTHKFHTEQEMVLPLKLVNLQGVRSKPATSEAGSPTTRPTVEINLTVDRDHMLQWKGKDLMTDQPKDSTPMTAIHLFFRTDNACDEAARALLELARKAQGVPEPAPSES